MSSLIGTAILWSNRFGEATELIPKLPDGFKLDAKPECWVLAIAPGGQVYYVGRDRLYPRRQRVDTGTFFIDTQNGVIQLDMIQHDETNNSRAS